MIKTLFAYVVLLSSLSIEAARSQEESFASQLSNEKVDQFPSFEDLTEISDPFELRDPFVPPEAFRGEGFLVETGPQSSDQAPSTETILRQVKSLDELKIVGILTDGQENRAMVEVGGETVVLKEGMTIGEAQSKILAIRERGMIIGEKRLNIYRKEQLVERVIRLDRNGNQEIFTRGT
jgi:Tfp pilus assembly protein PilP